MGSESGQWSDSARMGVATFEAKKVSALARRHLRATAVRAGEELGAATMNTLELDGCVAPPAGHSAVELVARRVVCVPFGVLCRAG